MDLLNHPMILILMVMVAEAAVDHRPIPILMGIPEHLLAEAHLLVAVVEAVLAVNLEMTADKGATCTMTEIVDKHLADLADLEDLVEAAMAEETIDATKLVPGEAADDFAV